MSSTIESRTAVPELTRTGMEIWEPVSAGARGRPVVEPRSTSPTPGSKLQATLRLWLMAEAPRERTVMVASEREFPVSVAMPLSVPTVRALRGEAVKETRPGMERSWKRLRSCVLSSNVTLMTTCRVLFTSPLKVFPSGNGEMAMDVMVIGLEETSNISTSLDVTSLSLALTFRDPNSEASLKLRTFNVMLTVLPRVALEATTPNSNSPALDMSRVSSSLRTAEATMSAC
jgi:hypothetical protein